MSRTTILTHPPYHHAVVGFDPPLGTYFAQIYRGARPPRLVRWLGAELQELPTIEAFCTALAPYAPVPADLRQRLAAEQRARGFCPHLGTQLLRQLRQVRKEEPS